MEVEKMNEFMIEPPTSRCCFSTVGVEVVVVDDEGGGGCCVNILVGVPVADIFSTNSIWPPPDPDSFTSQFCCLSAPPSTSITIAGFYQNEYIYTVE
jgi:hypothetical protein